MENKNVGWLVVGIGILMIIVVTVFNIGLKKIVAETCTHGTECAMYDTVAIQTWVSISIILIIFAIGIVIMFTKPKEKIIVKTKMVREKSKKVDLSGLDKIEKKAVEFLQNENGGMFQADLMEKLGMGKVGMTRLLDKLEAKQIVERKRRGMTNLVVLKS